MFLLMFLGIGFFRYTAASRLSSLWGFGQQV
jgi:hypothetical protein